MKALHTRPGVRLSAQEIERIRATAERLFGEGARVWLFGSRVDEAAKGGDIDLLVETAQILPNRVASAVRFASELQLQLGERKIDVIVVDPQTPPQSIHRIARETGVIL